MSLKVFIWWVITCVIFACILFIPVSQLLLHLEMIALFAAMCKTVSVAEGN